MRDMEVYEKKLDSIYIRIVDALNAIVYGNEFSFSKSSETLAHYGITWNKWLKSDNVFGIMVTRLGLDGVVLSHNVFSIMEGDIQPENVVLSIHLMSTLEDNIGITNPEFNIDYFVIKSIQDMNESIKEYMDKTYG